MGWKKGAIEDQRLYLAEAVIKKGRRLSEVCRELGISRPTGYKWVQRYLLAGIQGLTDRSHSSTRQGRQLDERLVQRLIGLRREHPTWGSKKLLTKLINPKSEAPCSARTLSRWLQRFKLVKTSRRRFYHHMGGQRPKLTGAYAANVVWTVDFKGVFHTQDGKRADALTVRDLYSRYGLAIELVRAQDDPTVREAFIRIFKIYGMPQIIRVDNGVPFAGKGPYGYSSLSLWWRRLGIKVEFTRPARPCDNGSHEQFHRIYKAETLNPAALDLALQQQRSNQWLIHYNHQRPHEALGQLPPAKFYRHSRRRYREVADRFDYPKSYKVMRVSSQGFLVWRKRLRYISRIAARLKIGLKPISSTSVLIYVDKIIIGSLCEEDQKGMRPAKTSQYQSVKDLMS